MASPTAAAARQPPVRDESRAEQAYYELRQLVTSADVRPGDRLAEVQTAEWLGISRTPVREALQRLEHEGLLRRGPKGGFLVAGLTERDVRESCQMLEMLDVRIFQAAAAGLSQTQGERLLRSARAMAAAAEADDIAAWQEADHTFHTVLQEAADNNLMGDLARKLRRRLHRFWVPSATRQGRLDHCAAEHLAIAEAVRAADDEAIEGLVADHVEHMRASLLRMLADAAPFVREHGKPVFTRG